MSDDGLLDDLAAGYEAHGYVGTYHRGAWVGEHRDRAVVVRPAEVGVEVLVFWDSGHGLFQLFLLTVHHHNEVQPAIVWSGAPTGRGTDRDWHRGAR